MKKPVLFIQFLLIGMLVTVFNAYSQTTDPIAYWNFDENDGTSVFDSKSNFEGTLMGQTVFDDTEKIEGSSLLFDGSTGFVQTNLSTEIQETENVTFMAWFNSNVVEVTQQHIFWIGDIAGNGWGGQQELHITLNHFNADLQNSNICLFYGSSDDKTPNNVNIVSSDASFGANEWHHIAGVIKNMSGIDGATEAELYLDGVMITPYDWTTTAYGFACSNTTSELIDRSTWNSPLLIGIGGVGTRAFNGYLDEVKVFDVALTENDIISAMETGGTKVKPSVKSKNECFIYPNPVKDNLLIRNNSNINSIEILDVTGKNILSTPSKNNINLSHLQNGVYFVKLNSKNGSSMQRIIKQ